MYWCTNVLNSFEQRYILYMFYSFVFRRTQTIYKTTTVQHNYKLGSKLWAIVWSKLYHFSQLMIALTWGWLLFCCLWHSQNWNKLIQRACCSQLWPCNNFLSIKKTSQIACQCSNIVPPASTPGRSRFKQGIGETKKGARTWLLLRKRITWKKNSTMLMNG